MKECSNNDLAHLLHAYELGILQEAELREFETHLLVCTHCFTRAQQMRSVTRLLRADPEVRGAIFEISELSVEEESSEPGSSGRGMRLTRMLLVAAAVALLAWPAYRVGTWLGKAEATVQTIVFEQLRSTNQNSFDLSLGGELEVRFYLEDGRAPENYRLEVVDSHGLTIFSRNGVEVTDSEQGSWVVQHLPLGIFESQLYSLRLYKGLTDQDSLVNEFYFRAK